MNLTWNDLTFLPSDEALAELRTAWAWLLPDVFEPVMASTLGDVFFQQGGLELYWLNTGTAEITCIAASREQFLELLKTEQADEWFMPHLIEALKTAGKKLHTDQCYSYVTLPVFQEGKYEVWNLNPVLAAEHFRITGDVHRRLRALPNGAKVRIDIQRSI
jgi:hypothetical protein